MSLLKSFFKICLVLVAAVLLISHLVLRASDPALCLNSSWNAVKQGLATLVEAGKRLQDAIISTNDLACAASGTNDAAQMPLAAPEASRLSNQDLTAKDLAALVQDRGGTIHNLSSNAPIASTVDFDALLKKVRTTRERLLSNR